MNSPTASRSRIVWAFVALLGALSSCASSGNADPIDERARIADGELLAVNATLVEPGAYHVTPVLSHIDHVELRTAGGTSRPLTDDDWTFDDATGRLSVNVPVDDPKELVVIHGVREIPWGWRIREGFDADSVRALFDERAGVRGVDFDVDGETRLVRFLKPELCDADANHFVIYSMQPDPKKPEVTMSVSFGNHRDPNAIRTFLGLPEKPVEATATGPAVMSTSLAMNAIATDDPGVYRVSRALAGDGLKVGIGDRASSSDVDWLEPDVDYTYDETEGLVRLKSGVTLEGGQYVLLIGQPR